MESANVEDAQHTEMLDNFWGRVIRNSRFRNVSLAMREHEIEDASRLLGGCFSRRSSLP